MMRKTTILTLTLSLLSSVQLWAKDYRVSDFGAVADGTTLNTRALQRAIDVIHEEGGGKLIFPLGRYVSGTLHLLSVRNVAPGERRRAARLEQPLRL